MNQLTQILNTKYPIIQAPMTLADSPALVAAISNQGGLGSFGAGALTIDEIRVAIREIRKLTHQPFAINLFAPTPKPNNSAEEIKQAQRALNYFRKKLNLPALHDIDIKPQTAFEEQLAVIIEEKVPVFSFTFGVLSKEIIERIKISGIRVIGTATTVHEAILLEKNGVDAIVAQGYEAGGHRGTDLTITSLEDALIGTFALVPQVVDATKIPVIAAGGIMDGRGVRAAFALGAIGVQMGTAFLTCPESNIHEVYRKALLNSTDESTRLTRAFTGRMARAIKNDFLLEMEENHFPILDYPLQRAIVKDIGVAAKAQNNLNYIPLWAGQGSWLCRDKSATEVFQAIINEAKDVL